MIRCAAFCFCRDEEDARRAEKAAASIPRRSSAQPLRLVVDGGTVVTMPLGEGSAPPVVHGWAREGGGGGEFAMLSAAVGGPLAMRDHAGTRPLCVARSAKWAASDHRFFPGAAYDLLPPGAGFDFATMKAVTTSPVREKFEGTYGEACSGLARVVERSVSERVAGVKKVAVAFSGGLDSSLIAACAKKRAEVVACSVFSKGSRDSVGAARAAEAVGVEWLGREVDEEMVRQELREMDLPFVPTPMDAALWCLYSFASRLALEADAGTILLGQLADELFGGYQKYERSLPEADAEMEADIVECGMRGLLRDEAACSRWAEPRFPLADESVLSLGRALPVGFKIRNGTRKAVLREAARLTGVPEELCVAPKKAAQYSSGVQKLLHRVQAF